MFRKFDMFRSAGLAVPMLMSSPYHTERQNKVTYSMASLLDIVPTVLDWFKILDYPLFTGRSLLPLLIQGLLLSLPFVASVIALKVMYMSAFTNIKVK